MKCHKVLEAHLSLTGRVFTAETQLTLDMITCNVGLNYLSPRVIWGRLITVSHKLRLRRHYLPSLGNCRVMRFRPGQTHNPNQNLLPCKQPQNKDQLMFNLGQLDLFIHKLNSQTYCKPKTFDDAYSTSNTNSVLKCKGLSRY